MDPALFCFAEAGALSRNRRRRQYGPQVPRAQKGVTISDVSATSVLDFLTIGGSSSVSSQLTAAEAYWVFANHHPWVGTAVRLIAGAIAADSYDVVAPGVDKDQDEVDHDPRVQAIRLLLDAPNNDEGLEDLIESVSQDVDVTGRGFMHILRLAGADSMLVGLERIDSRTMAPKLSDDATKIVKFIQRVNVNGRAQMVEYNPRDIIYFNLPGGKDVIGGESLLEQLDLTLAVDWAARKHNAAYFRNGAKAGTVYINKKSDQKQAEANKKTIELTRVGTENAYRPLILSGDWDVIAPKTDADEEFQKGQDRARQEVCAVFRIPESKLVSIEGTLGQAGKEVDDQTFHEECVAPRAKRIYAQLTRRVLRDEFGITDLALRPRAKYQVRLSAIALAVQVIQSGGSINEARALVGWPKSAFKGADLDTPYVASTVKAVQDPVDPLELAAATRPQLPAGPGGAKPPGANTPPQDEPAKKADDDPKVRARAGRGRFRVSRDSEAT